jgi:hypothetical protein
MVVIAVNGAQLPRHLAGPHLLLLLLLLSLGAAAVGHLVHNVVVTPTVAGWQAAGGQQPLFVLVAQQAAAG